MSKMYRIKQDEGRLIWKYYIERRTDNGGWQKLKQLRLGQHGVDQGIMFFRSVRKAKLWAVLNCLERNVYP